MQQIIFPFVTTDSYHQEEFIDSISNHEVYNKIKGWEKSWGTPPYEFSLLIYGAKSSGKTYLTKIWQNLSGAFVINHDSIFHEDSLNNYQAFIIENIENWSEEAILHYFNLINEKQKYLLMTTSNLDHNFKLQDLLSRINSILRLEIKQADDELMKILLFKLFSNNSVKISNEVLNCLLINLPREFKKIIESVDKINQFALRYKRKITLNLVKQVLELD